MRDLAFFTLGFVAGIILTGIVVLTTLDNRMDNLQPTIEELIMEVRTSTASTQMLNTDLKQAITDAKGLGFAWIDLRDAIRYEWVGIVNTRR